MTSVPSSSSVEEFRASTQASRLRSTPAHEQIADKLFALYREQGLLPGGRDASLRCCCPHSAECWQGAPPADNQQDSGIAVPWIGARYFETKIVLLGLNFNDFGGLAGHYWVCEDHIAQMKANRRGKDNRAFSRNAMLYLRLVLGSLQGQLPRAIGLEEKNEDLAALWEACAFLETIKCSPGTKGSYPTAAMFGNCPEFVAQRELSILQPKVIMVFGRTHLRDKVRPWAVPEWGYGEQTPPVERDTASIDGRIAELVSVNHPSGRADDVRASLSRLHASLKARPIMTRMPSASCA